MKNKFRYFTITISLLICSLTTFSQVLSVSPAYPTVNDTVTIIYNAVLGNGALAGIAPIFMHTGVITKESANNHDWMHKKAGWYELDSSLMMQNIGTNLFKAKFHVKSWYGINLQEIVKELCFVFKNADGSLAGKNTDGSDILVHVYQPNVFARFTTPADFPLMPALSSQIHVTVSSKGKSMINLYHDGSLVAQAYDSVLSINLTASSYGKHWYWFNAQQNGQTVIDSMYYIVPQPETLQNAPSGTRDGINYINDSTVILQLYAPYKQQVYLIGDFNNWQLNPNYKLIKTVSQDHYWIQLNHLISKKEYRFQYLVDNTINIGDPYSDKFLDRWNDSQIHPTIYPNLIQYPVNKTSEMVSVLQTGQTPYHWQDTTYQKPDNRDLVIYELLVRDYHLWHNYQTILDSIKYLKDLGINAIELMPVMEYEGNDSWGYMPVAHFAPDKCYGTKAMLKKFIDEAHKQGMAIILDIVFNHCSPQNMMARLYYDEEHNRPTSQSPWFNQCIPHPYGYTCDYNHASYQTQAYVDSVLNYWSSEYHVDGYRFDLSKGFTNRVSVTYNPNEQCAITGTDVGGWGAYDADRIYFLKRMASKIWSHHPGTYLILEHFAENTEETELQGSGFMIWSGMSGNERYSQATMGFTDNSDFEWTVSYKSRNWSFHNLVGYMESHDEERLMYKNYAYGNFKIVGTDTVYNTRKKATALQRMAEGAAFFFTVPGPKMFWQFGERGYDYSINWPSMTGETRTDKKPPKWEYMKEYDRVKLYKKYAALIKLKTTYPLFRTSNFIMNTGSYDKRIRLWDDGYVGADFAAIVIGNFDVEKKPVWPEFSHSGKWFDYFTQDSLDVSPSQIQGSGFTIDFDPGEFRIYTDKKLPMPDLTVNIDTTSHSIKEISKLNAFNTVVFPNPFNKELNIYYTVAEASKINISIYDIYGKKVAVLADKKQAAGIYSVIWNDLNGLQKGTYYYRITSEKHTQSGKVVYMDE